MGESSKQLQANGQEARVLGEMAHTRSIIPNINTIPPYLCPIAKQLVLCCHLLATFDLLSALHGLAPDPPGLHSLPAYPAPPPNPSFLVQKSCCRGALGVVFGQQQGGHEAGVDRGKGERQDMNWTSPYLSSGPIRLWQRPLLCDRFAACRKSLSADARLSVGPGRQKAMPAVQCPGTSPKQAGSGS